MTAYCNSCKKTVYLINVNRPRDPRRGGVTTGNCPDCKATITAR